MELNLSWVIQTIIMLGLGTIAYFLKEFKKSIDKNISETNWKTNKNQEDIKELKEEFNEHKVRIAKEYVHKDDFIRAMSNVDKKLDKIHDVLVVKRSV
ncbi:hypothetical protein Amet_4371 [Alkaliphilus metalliredigens QYMF]|uniref:Uncharacterized protein n=1 Tax=Alkaliphilus metalliredigens (strain QYMF) TaxID=293826 RepID=A6TKC1_ALKMQ|nr:hypothetical protein [Alkaliphilus metalliredigens]ABR46639.1 hypothetical protein Amet_0411 [Alkaliphilus metalliredigens QYMF]ABR48111.1 hypothetical protein Amet_1948 [Alkaliphilus metalliredigens QYMF]ABR50445.1 hypothetical protein Amet_4371 [Alkaliphilus metalliredigens QYMF]